MGWALRQLSLSFNLQVPNLSTPLQVFGTIGLILIVLEGSLELEFNKKKKPLIIKSTAMALVPLVVFSLLVGYAFSYFANVSFKLGIANALPLAVISSAIAIPTAKSLKDSDKEFVTYESSLSDIFGVILFNFVVLNETINSISVGVFLLEIVAILVISFVATLALALFLKESKHHVKFVPIILFVILIYGVSKLYHLPSLLFILLFGLVIGNLDEFRKYKFIENLKPQILQAEVHKFRDLNIELTFIIRVLFFLLFGFLIETDEIVNPATLIWAGAITSLIFILRALMLWILKIELKPLMFIAPRGLVSILLFLSLPQNQIISIANRSLLVQVVLLTALMLMIGNLMIPAKPKEKVIAPGIH